MRGVPHASLMMAEAKALVESTATVHHHQLSTRSCPACNSDDGLRLGEKNGFQLLSCRNCKTLYASRLPDSCNTADYDDYYDPEKHFTPDFMRRRMDEIVSTFQAYRQTNRLLEVGFGAGALLEAAARAGWNVEGLEMSQTAVEQAQRKGLKAFCGELGEAAYMDDLFDVVVASEVLEHVFDPQQFTTEIRRVLRPGGLFWATTPHGRGIAAQLIGLKWADVCPPDHLQLFSLRGIKTLLDKSGFLRARVFTRGANPSEICQTLKSRYMNRDDGSKSANLEEELPTSREPTENWTKSFPRRAVKGTANLLLSLTHLGDSLQIRAEK
jgi:SAM-dependent methyltransferase